MDNKHRFPLYSPCYEGTRFEDHSFPLNLLGDLMILRSMTIEMAKAIYLEKNPERKRIPRNFTNGISIDLEGIEPGSAIPNIFLKAPSEGFFPGANTDYYLEAPQRITKAIESAHLNKEISDLVPNNVLGYFNQLGSNLRDDERINFGKKNESQAILDKDSRKRLVLAASKTKEYNSPFEIRGIVTALDKDRKTFEIQTTSGERLKGEYSLEYLEILQSALVEMENNRKVLIKGVATFNAFDKLIKVDSLDDAVSLDHLDVPARLEELSLLKQGWLDGEQGDPLDIDSIKWLGETFDKWYDGENLPLPATFPTPEGNIQFEWTLNHHEISLMVNLENQTAEYYSLNTQSKDDISESMDLNKDEAWVRLIQLIKDIHG